MSRKPKPINLTTCFNMKYLTYSDDSDDQLPTNLINPTDLTEEYRLVQDLMVGDLVKVYNNEPKRIKMKIQGSFINNPNNPKKCMYVMKKTEDNELIDDLIVTGLHGILLDEPDERNPKWANFKVDDKYNVIASISNKFEQIKNNELYNYYHFSLDNGTERKRLGVWANGVLMETLSSNK
jgi:hypothetical protein